MDSNWKDYLNRNGGKDLIFRYLHNGVLFTALNQFVVLGRSKKALELLRLAVEYKFLSKLRKENSKKIEKFAETNTNRHNDSYIEKSKIIWLCWWQGIENAPTLVQKCYASVCHYCSDWEINVITEENYFKFVEFPQYIIDKWKLGIISHTHMSDLLRLELLIRYGGLWLDSTILVTSSDIPKSILESNLFFYQTLKPGADGHSILLSNWLIYSKSGNAILKLTKELLYKFWKYNDEITDYFLFHYYMTLSCEVLKEEYDKIPQFSNEIPHILQLNIFRKFDESYFDDLCKMSCFHKLSYKLDLEKIENSAGSYYDWILKLKF